MKLSILPPEEILETTVKLPQSKSMSARAMVIASLTPGAPAIAPEALADCDDIRALSAALGSRSGIVSAGESGTALRFLTALFAATEGCDVALTGEPGLLVRPVAQLVDALRSLGADITYTATEGHAPLAIKGRRIRGGRVSIDAGVSSQFVSALMLVAPTFSDGLRIDFADTPRSLPYIKMTAAMMERAGADVELDRDGVTVRPGAYKPVAQTIEPDWSAAAFWYEIAALTAGWVTLTGLAPDSLQGDSAAAELFPRLGVLTEFTDEGAELSATPDLWSHLEYDASGTPDMVPALASTACAVGIPFNITGVATLRAKESDRLEALRAELGKLGFDISLETRDAIIWDGSRHPIFEMPVIDARNDHRIAMAFAPVAVFVPGLVIDGAECVAKSYPEFWDSLRAAGFEISETE